MEEVAEIVFDTLPNGEYTYEFMNDMGEVIDDFKSWGM
jgi:hypothetical protein